MLFVDSETVCLGSKESTGYELTVFPWLSLSTVMNVNAFIIISSSSSILHFPLFEEWEAPGQGMEK